MLLHLALHRFWGYTLRPHAMNKAVSPLSHCGTQRKQIKSWVTCAIDVSRSPVLQSTAVREASLGEALRDAKPSGLNDDGVCRQCIGIAPPRRCSWPEDCSPVKTCAYQVWLNLLPCSTVHHRPTPCSSLCNNPTSAVRNSLPTQHTEQTCGASRDYSSRIRELFCTYVCPLSSVFTPASLLARAPRHKLCRGSGICLLPRNGSLRSIWES